MSILCQMCRPRSFVFVFLEGVKVAAIRARSAVRSIREMYIVLLIISGLITCRLSDLWYPTCPEILFSYLESSLNISLS